MLTLLKRDFFLDKQREKAKLEAEMKLMVTLQQLIPAGIAKPVAPLGVILSQYYLNLTEFCKDFNTKSQDWTEGILLPVKVKKGLRAKEYKLFIYQPTFSFLIDNSLDNYGFSVVMAFDIVRFKAKLFNKSLRPIAKLFSSTLHTHKKIKIDFREPDFSENDENDLNYETEI
jgi:ribosomal protein L11